MKPSKKLLVLGLMSVLTLAGCSDLEDKKDTKPSDGDGTPVQPESKKVVSVSLNKKTLSIEEESSETLIATINPSDAENQGLVWSSSDEEVAMVNGLGKVRALKAGTATITVASAEDPTKKDDCVVTVTAKDRTIAVSGVSLNQESLSLDKGDKVVLIATVAPNDATNKEVEWSTKDATIATVTSAGLVEGISKGTTTITVKSVADPTKKAECEVTVVDNYIAVNSVRISSTDEHFEVVGNEKHLELQDVDRPLGTLNVTVKGLNDDNEEVDPTNPRVIWSVVSGADVVTVSSSGQVTALKVGTAVVRATSEDDPTKYDEVTVTVVAETPKDTTIHVDSIAWGANLPSSINLGDEANISVTVSPSNTNYTKINFSLAAGDSEFATLQEVSNNVCKIIAVKPGQITLTAAAEDQVNSPEALVATINIVDPIIHVTGIDLDASLTNLVLFKGDNLDLASKYTVLPATATNKAVVFESSNEEVLLVSNTGKLTARKAGTATITITSVQDASIHESFEVRVKNIQVDTIDGIPATKTIEKGDTFQLEPVINYKDGSTASNVTYEVDNTDIINVSASGLITAKAKGDAIITVKAPKANDDDPLVSVTCEVTVVDTKPVISQMNKPLSILSFEQRTRAENLTSIDHIYENSNPDKGHFFEAENADELIYKVGNKGLFKYYPTVLARYNGESEDRAYEGTVEFERTLQEKTGTDTYVEASSTDYTETENGIEFKDSALGKEFKLSVTPVATDDYNVKDTIGVSTVEFKVIKGYNAYSLAELSLYNNILTTSSSNPVDWATYREQQGLHASVNDANDGIVLHKDITINDSVLPAAAVLTQDYWDYYLGTSTGQTDFTAWLGAINDALGEGNHISAQKAKETYLYGACRDYQTLFARRTFELDDNFVLEGNYFTIDASNFKQIVKADDESLQDFMNGDGSHSQLFGINVNYWQNQTSEQDIDNITFKNFHIKGNGSISGEKVDVLLAKGGFMGVKAGGVNFTGKNIINHATFSAFLSEGHNAINIAKETMTLDRCMIYDTYNSSLYVWGTNKNFINNSWLSQSGGPLVLMDEYNADEKYVEASSHFNQTKCICDNVYMHNPVHGTEPWFVSHPGSGDLVVDYFVNAGTTSGWIGGYAATQFADDVPTARTITGKDNAGEGIIDFIAIDMNASHFNDNIYCQLSGQFKVTNGTEVGLLDMAETVKNEYHTTTLIGDKITPIMGKTSKGGIGAIYLDPANGYAQTPYYSGKTFAQGNFFSYYLDPWMGAHATPAEMADGTVFKGYFFGVFLGTYSIAEHWAA